MPLLMVANAAAVFELADSLRFAERLYLTLPDQDHNDFIDQGIVHHLFECAVKPGDTASQARWRQRGPATARE